MTTSDLLIDFLDKCPTPFNFISYARTLLLSHGFTEVADDSPSTIYPSKGFLIRHNRGLIAFNNGGLDRSLIIATHCDSPCLRIDSFADTPEIPLSNLTVSPYGGGLWYSYLNRDLRVAGQVLCRDGEVPFDSEEPIAFIAYSQIQEVQANLDLSSAILSFGDGSLREYVTEKVGKEVLSWELSCVDGEKPAAVGLNREFVASHRLDNQASTFSAITAFLETEPSGWLNVLAVLDHEEVGSATLEGARGHFLRTTMERIVGVDDFLRVMARSYAVSCDSAQGFHPNFAEKFDRAHAPVLGGGVALKRSPGTSYATNVSSSLAIEKACKKLGLKLQWMMNRNDLVGGSTIGPAIAMRLGVSTVDLGQPLLAMHSIRELIAVSDVDDTTKLFRELFEHFDEYWDV